jgi:hypothetical protein
MAGLMKRETRGETEDVVGRLDRMFDEWARMLPFRAMTFPSARPDPPITLADAWA